ncbi:hypothetical protein HK102_009157 [Quaeritorhiza haematococci]|nr:hypothetical protein HK102_009157 [Quaeritorhiza haematococci]
MRPSPVGQPTANVGLDSGGPVGDPRFNSSTAQNAHQHENRAWQQPSQMTGRAAGIEAPRDPVDYSDDDDDDEFVSSLEDDNFNTANSSSVTVGTVATGPSSEPMPPAPPPKASSSSFLSFTFFPKSDRVGRSFSETTPLLQSIVTKNYGGNMTVNTPTSHLLSNSSSSSSISAASISGVATRVSPPLRNHGAVIVRNTAPASRSYLWETPERARLRSLDLLRGLTICLMIIVNYQFENLAFPQLIHAEWIGLTMADLVFPTFLFICGAAIPLAEHLRPKSASCIFSRSIKLFIVGVLLNDPFTPLLYTGSLEDFRPMGVLQRIAVAYFGNAAFFFIKF